MSPLQVDTPERWQRVKAIVAAALEAPPDERATIVERRCGDDATLRREVEMLLAAVDESPDDRLLAEITSALAGRYAVEREIGRGGMAIVYCARDLKHERLVAIKVLRPELAALLGAERFLREISIAAHLQHPNILPLFDSGDTGHAGHDGSAGLLFYVMPFVDGDSLRARLARERQLPVDEAIHIAVSIAGALAYAHAHGVVHRDLKPENVLLQAGEPVIADFGIALAVEQAGGARLTETGLSLGTPQYMSPEQALGDPQITARADIYALGVMLYEMLAGEPPFIGASKQAVVARVLTEAPRRLTVQRPSVPAHVDAAVRAALEKLPADRFASAAEFARALDRPPIGSTSTADSASRVTRGAVGAAGFRRAPRAIAGTGWLLAIGLAIVLAIPRREHATARARATQRLDLLLPDSEPLDFVADARLGIGRRALAISPDGRTIVYVAHRRGTSGAMLLVRRLDEDSPRALPETDGASQPFFSPDGQWIGFLHGRELRKVSVAGGHVVTIATANEPTGAFWASDDRILLADKEGNEMRWVPVDGSASYPLAPAPEARYVQLPQILPGGKWMLHGAYDRLLYVTSLATGRAYVIGRDGIVPRDSADLGKLYFGENPRYVRSGHLLYLSGSGGPLMALPFDAAKLRVLGPPEPVLTGIRQEADIGAGQFAVSLNGTIVYAPGQDASMSRFVLVDSTGRRQFLPLPPRDYESFQLSPDGTRILVRLQSGSSIAELWVVDIATGRYSPIPVQPITGFLPRWWPDGKHIVTWNYIWRRGGAAGVLLLPVTGDGPVDTLLPRGGSAQPSPDGKHMLVGGYPGPGLWLITIGGGAPPVRLSRSFLSFASWSPDGRWITFKDSVGTTDVYALDTQHPGERYSLSQGAGEEPIWSPRGDEIVYRNDESWLAVHVDARRHPRFAVPRLLFEGPYINVPGWSHDITPDGRRQLLLLGPDEQTTTRLKVVTGWFDELRRVAPTEQR